MEEKDIQLLKIIVDKIEEADNGDEILEYLKEGRTFESKNGYGKYAEKGLVKLFKEYITLNTIEETNYVLQNATEYRDYILMEHKIREENKKC